MREQTISNQRTFGRRPGAQPVPSRPISESNAATEAAIDGTSEVRDARAAQISWSAVTAEAPSVEQELREWNEARKQRSKIPWRQLSFMASLCFGIASVVLPESTNDSVQWVLYALMAASLYAGFAKRRKPK